MLKPDIYSLENVLLALIFLGVAELTVEIERP
jgi:hypothetical protein